MPSTPRAYRASSTPIIPSNNGNGHNDRPLVVAGDLCVGCIVWLPPRVLSANTLTCGTKNCCGKELEDGGYDHPVVVLSMKQKEGSYILGDLICTVACVGIILISKS